MGNAQLVKQHLGKTVPVGKFKVQLLKLLAEGGFGYVFLVKDTSSGQLMALKRLLVSDEESFRKVILEVEFLKKLSPHKNIVRYFDSCTNNMKNGEREVLILMEYCSGGLVEQMNHRMNNRYSEKEIWEIFSDVCEGLTQMHIQDPPIAHRDLKVENVLLGDIGERKLCDFGSATTRIYRCANNKHEMVEAEDDISKNTTLTYRAPEMIDLYSNKDISEKVDIWALGVFLYKLAYFITPFEEDGQLAIVNAKYRFLDSPSYSSSLKKMITFLLDPNPDTRPNIFDVMEQLSKITGVSLPSLKKRPEKKQVIKEIKHPEEVLEPKVLESPNSPNSTRRLRTSSPKPVIAPATVVSYSTGEAIQALPPPELRSPKINKRRPGSSRIAENEGVVNSNHPQFRHSSSSIPPLQSVSHHPQTTPPSFDAEFSANFQSTVTTQATTQNNPFLDSHTTNFNAPFDFNAFNSNPNSNNPFVEPTPKTQPSNPQPTQTPPVNIQNNPFLSSISTSQNQKQHVHFGNPAPTPYHTPEVNKISSNNKKKASPRITPEASPATSPNFIKGPLLFQHRRTPSGDIILPPPPTKGKELTHRRSQSAHYRSMPANSDSFSLLNKSTNAPVPNLIPPPSNQSQQQPKPRGHRALDKKSQSSSDLTGVNVQNIDL